MEVNLEQPTSLVSKRSLLNCLRPKTDQYDPFITAYLQYLLPIEKDR